MCRAYIKLDFASLLDIKISVHFQIKQQFQWQPCLFLPYATLKPISTFRFKIKLRGNKYINRQIDRYIDILEYSAHIQKRNQYFYFVMELPAKLGGKPLVLSTAFSQLRLDICWVQSKYTRSKCRRLCTLKFLTLKGYSYVQCQYCI